jgi:hypothetical protein
MLLHSFAKMHQLTNDMNYVSLKSVITSYAMDMASGQTADSAARGSTHRQTLKT